MKPWNGVLLILAALGAGAVEVSSPPQDSSGAEPKLTSPACRGWYSPDGPCGTRIRVPPPSFAKFTAIREDDDRKDFYCLDRGDGPAPAAARIPMGEKIAEVKEASVALMFDDQLERDPVTGNYTLRARAHLEVANDVSWPGASQHLCADEAYAKQPRAANCSGVLIAEDRVVTVRHCLEPSSKGPSGVPRKYHDLRFVFGFRMADAQSPTSFTFPAEDVCWPKPSTTFVVVNGKAVVAEIECGTAKARTVATLAQSPIAPDPAVSCTPCGCTAPEREACIYAFGYPEGLPAKFSGWGRATNFSHPTMFGMQIDVAQGNSGSPIFNARHELVGVLDREGNDSFCESGGCARWKGCCRDCKDPAKAYHLYQSILDSAILNHRRTSSP